MAPWRHWEKEVTYKFLGTPSDEPEPAGARTVSFENPWLHLCLKKRWLKCGENHPLHEGLSMWKRGKPLKFPLKKKKNSSIQSCQTSKMAHLQMQKMQVLIPGLGRSSGERTGNLLQYSCVENSMDRGAW